MKRLLAPAVFGMADGLTCALGAVMSLSGHPELVFRTAFALSVAECVGMSAGEWLSESDSGFASAAVIGVFTGVGGLVPAVPYAFLSGGWAAAFSVATFALCAFLILLVRRPARGLLRASVETYGVLAAVGIVVWMTQLLMPKGGGP